MSFSDPATANAVNATIAAFDALGVNVYLLSLDIQKADAVFLNVCAVLVFAAQIGFAMLEVGSVRVKNTKGILLKNVMDLCASAVSFFLIGYGLALGKSVGGGVFGGRVGDGFAMRTDNLSGSEATGDVVVSYSQAFFTMCFSATSATIVSGAVAERCSFRAYFVAATLVSGLIFPVVVHWSWGDDGWLAPVRSQHKLLSSVGVLDYAGSGFVHVVGGCAAFWLTYLIGPRQGRFTKGKRAPNPMPQQSPVFQVIGGLIMWYGWYGFTCGSIKTLAGPRIASLARVGLIHTLSGAVGGCTVMAIDLYLEPNVFMPFRMIYGSLSALVAASASAAHIHISISLCIAFVAGFIYVITSHLMTHVWRLDDVVDAVPIHFFNGIWGVIAAALFSDKRFLQQTYGEAYAGCGLVYGCAKGPAVLGNAMLYIVSIIIWVTVTFVPVMWLIKKYGWLRISSEQERIGTDAALHGGESYPEFQSAIFNFKDKITGSQSKLEMRVRASEAAKIATTLAALMDTSVTSDE